MNKRILVAAGVIAAVTSSAFAAGVDVNATNASLADVATGSVSVDACTNALLLDVTPGAYDATAGDWGVASVDIKADGAVNLDACIGFDVTAVITVDNAGVLGSVTTDTLNVAAGTASLSLTPSAATGVNKVVKVDVLVDEPNL